MVKKPNFAGSVGYDEYCSSIMVGNKRDGTI
jgi:hypothetical protein